MTSLVFNTSKVQLSEAKVREVLDAIAEALKGRVREAFVFGSASTGDFRADSDIDLILVCDDVDPIFEHRGPKFIDLSLFDLPDARCPGVHAARARGQIGRLGPRLLEVGPGVDEADRLIRYARANSYFGREPRVERDGDFGSTTYYENGPSAVLALADAVDGDFSRVGWDEAMVMDVARKLLRQPLAVRLVARWLDLTEAQIRVLSEDFFALQWLENEYRMGRIDLETPRRLAQVIDERAARAYPYGTSLDGIIRELILDPAIPYDVAIAIHDLLKARWSKVAPKSSHFYVTSPDRFALTEEQLSRAERFYGRGTIRPEAVWAEARAAARDVEATLRRAKFATVPEFLATFAFSRFFTAPAGRELDDVETQHMRALAEVYFGVLRARLPEFFALKPRAIDVRWVLETPLQISLALHDDGLWRRRNLPFWRRWITPKDKVIGPGEYLTAHHIFGLLHETLETFVPTITSIEDFNEVMTFRVRGAFEYEQFQRYAADRYAKHAARIGDQRLDWTEIPRFENAQAWKMRRSVDDLEAYGILVRLRAMVPPEERSDETLTAKAVEILLGSDFGDLAGDRLRAQLNHPVRRAILALALDDPDQAHEQDVPPEIQRSWIEAMQADLFDYLAARTAAGAKIPVSPGEVAALAALAGARGFTVRFDADGFAAVKRAAEPTR